MPLRWLGFRRAQRPSSQVRQLLNITTIVRWVGLVAAGIIGVAAPPRASLAFVLLILGVGAYNSWSMLAARRAGDASLLRVARTAAFFDMVGCLIFLAIFTDLPGGSQSAFYVPILIEAVAIDGIDGAIMGVLVFVVGILAIQGGTALFAHRAFAWTVVLVWGLIMLVVAAALGAADQLSLAASPLPGPPQEGEGKNPARGSDEPVPLRPAVRLSPREQEVLRLIAEGNSNAMIAERLHLSETTVKTYVENLLVRLSARNRAEAVAAASRMRIL